MIKLYVQQGCPYCDKVLRAATALGMQADRDYQLIDAAPGKPGSLTVMALGGQSMVPFMVDGDTAMYESADIIRYLQEKSSVA